MIVTYLNLFTFVTIGLIMAFSNGYKTILIVIALCLMRMCFMMEQVIYYSDYDVEYTITNTEDKL